MDVLVPTRAFAAIRGVWLRRDARPFRRRVLALCGLFASALCCGSSGANGEPWNAPYPLADRGRSILFSTFQTSPRHLDPVSSYSENEATFTGQIYEPPLQYHFLKRPYVLEPLTLEAMPEVEYRDATGQRLEEPVTDDVVASVVYRLRLRRGIHYAPHPALARDNAGRYRYHTLTRNEIGQCVVAETPCVIARKRRIRGVMDPAAQTQSVDH